MPDPNAIYTRRGQKFDIADYPDAVQKLIRSKLKTVDQVIQGLPRSFRFCSTLAMSQARGFLRKLSTRTDWEDVTHYGALTIEPYPILMNPHFRLISAYFSPLDRFVTERGAKTVSHMPRQFTQLCDTIKTPGMIDYIVHTVTPPDAEGFVNLGVNCDIQWESFRHFAQTKQTKIILEINSYVPWVNGHKDYDCNRIPLTWAECIYENHEPMPQLPPIVATETEERLAKNVLKYIKDGDTVQLGIGGVPNYIAEHLKDRRGLKFHSEMLTDAMVDLVNAGAVDNHGKAYMDGLTVGTFAAGTDKLYDWIDRNPEVVLLPIHAVNDPEVIGRNKRMKSINSALMVDLHGQVCSDALGFHQVSGIGGQLEFVMGAQRSEGGRSILCIKSTSKVRDRLLSNVVVALPAGSPVTVPRHFVDAIVTEWGAAEIKHLDAIRRAQALVEIAHPSFRSGLVRKAKALGLWEHRPGFDTFKRRAMFNNLDHLRRLREALVGKTRAQRAKFIFREIGKAMAAPRRIQRFRDFCRQNRTWA